MSFIKSVKEAFRRVSVLKPAKEDEGIRAARRSSLVVDEDREEDPACYETPVYEYLFSADEVGSKLESLSSTLNSTTDPDEFVSLRKWNFCVFKTHNILILAELC